MILLNILTTGEALLIGSIMWGLFTLMFFLRFFLDPTFSKKLPLYLKRLNGRKFVYLTLKVIGVITLLYFAGGFEYNQSRLISGLLLLSGVMVILMMGFIVNVSERQTLPEITQKNIRRTKLKKIQRKSLIYRIKNII